MLLDAMSIVGAGMYAQGARLATIASNLANADSTSTSIANQPYRAREVVFQAIPASRIGNGMSLDSVRVGAVVESNAPFPMTYDPGNPLANSQGYVRKSNVNPVESMVDMISASRAYQDNAAAANLLKAVALKTLTL